MGNNLRTWAGVHIVIVDDEPDALDVLRNVLEHYGARVTAIVSAYEVLAFLKYSNADLLISDIGMPIMNGLELIRHIRASEPVGTTLKAIALTAFSREEHEQQILTAGFHAHVAKPVDVEHLLAVVDQLLGQ